MRYKNQEKGGIRLKVCDRFSFYTEPSVHIFQDLHADYVFVIEFFGWFSIRLKDIK